VGKQRERNAERRKEVAITNKQVHAMRSDLE